MASPPLATVLFLALCVRAGAAPAQSLDDDRRRTLIADAEAARDANLHDQALALATRAGALRGSPSLRMMVAEEHLALQHGVDALDHATRCLVAAESDPSTRHRARIIAACRAIIDLLEPQMGRLRLEFATAAPTGLRLRVNGRELPRDAWQSPLPVLSGTAVVEGDGEGVAVFRTTVAVFAGTLSELRLRFTEPPPPPPLGSVDGGLSRPSARPSSPR
jgi:hypothetical protein